jgi:bacterioferritin (cytochrome b1)
MADSSFRFNACAIREGARRQTEQGPVTLAQRAPASCEAFGEDLAGLLRENLAAERIVIVTDQETVCWFGDGGLTTRCLIESILADEEHADDILDPLGAL